PLLMVKPKILVVGSINYDTIYQDVLEEGVNDNGIVYKHYTTANGGKGANQARALALMGAYSYMAGCVGNDDYGHSQIAGLKEAGVNTDYIRVDDCLQTGQSVMLMRKNGTYIGANVLGANSAVLPALVENALQNEQFDMVVMQLEMPLDTVYHTYEIAAKKNIPVILDPGPPKSISLDRLKGIYIISPNEDETEGLTGIHIHNESDALAAAKRLLQKSNAEYVILKLGSRGAYYYDGQLGKLYLPYPVNAVDSTAAGDSFTAELAISLASGRPMDEAIQRANAAGAICVSRYGGQLSVPSSDEVNRFLSKNR
ncbi:MAG: ribokinase, partial [Christensenella sp.]|uniref:ribokinase n=1 Tax=Christensenella sp. TaxID=1935934 RepID=UPI002B1E9E9C